ncbi:MAG TPA: cupredoxin domain-containing protein [Thermodesulfobacteriota bacterium]|nr:cupredoxin domain-containing protein [Thermodesulfobacteriota bacterium]
MPNLVGSSRFLFFMLFLFFFACAGQQKPVTVETGEKPVVIKASEFKFEPNDLRARKGEVLTIKVENVSNTIHNLTVKNPQGTVVADVNIAPNGATTTKIKLAEPGTYPFYCNRTFHSTLGMKGKIEVGP